MLDDAMLVLALLVLPVELEPISPDTRAPALIAQMGSEQFRRRETAHRQLRKLGYAARMDLEASRDHPDPEVRHRVRNLLEDLYAMPLPAGATDWPLLCSLTGPLAQVPYSEPPHSYARAQMVWWYQCRSLRECNCNSVGWWEPTERYATYLMIRDLRRVGATRASLMRIQTDMQQRTAPVPSSCPRCPKWIYQHWNFPAP